MIVEISCFKNVMLDTRPTSSHSSSSECSLFSLSLLNALKVSRSTWRMILR